MGICCADHATPLYPQKLALTSLTGGGRSVGIVRLRTKATERERERERERVLEMNNNLHWILEIAVTLSCSCAHSSYVLWVSLTKVTASHPISPTCLSILSCHLPIISHISPSSKIPRLTFTCVPLPMGVLHLLILQSFDWLTAFHHELLQAILFIAM